MRRVCFADCTDVVNRPGMPFIFVTNFVIQLEITEISSTKLDANTQLPSKPLKHWCNSFVLEYTFLMIRFALGARREYYEA